MKLVVDPDICQGHLRCYEIAPHLFGVDELGHAVVARDDLESDEDVALAQKAMRACPERAIRLRR